MSDNANATNLKELPTFSKLKSYEQLAIELRADGKSGEEIVNQINAEFNLAYKVQSIYQWFMAGGRLEQAYFEYTEAGADQALKIARTKLKRASEKAANTLDLLQNEGFEPTVRLGAAKTILAKYIPDKQVVIGQREDADDLPDELLKDARKVVESSADGEAAHDDAPNDAPAETPSGE